MRLKDVKQLERADLARRAKAARDEERALRQAERKANWAARWPRWTAWWEARSRELKIAATVVASVGAIAAGAAAVGQRVAHLAKRAWSFYAARDVGAPAQPPPTGAPTTAVDFPKTAARPSPPASPRAGTPTKD